MLVLCGVLLYCVAVTLCMCCTVHPSVKEEQSWSIVRINNQSINESVLINAETTRIISITRKNADTWRVFCLYIASRYALALIVSFQASLKMTKLMKKNANNTD